ncbi:MAG TPA: hypothetical protein VJQ43_00265 [Thermoplasmata archaeon]|nr:hypothetical protein [Thermoplasmata archaeon]
MERTGSSRVEREALEYLRREIRPALRRGERQVLARAITTAVDSGSVEDLGRLGERHRRELLETIESRLGPGRTAPTPRALVRITTVVGAAPDPTGVRSRVVASPAR